MPSLTLSSILQFCDVERLYTFSYSIWSWWTTCVALNASKKLVTTGKPQKRNKKRKAYHPLQRGSYPLLGNGSSAETHRNTGQLRQEGSPGNHWIQAPAQIRVRQSRLLRTMSSKVHSFSWQFALVLNHPQRKIKQANSVFLKEWFLWGGLTLAHFQPPTQPPSHFFCLKKTEEQNKIKMVVV